MKMTNEAKEMFREVKEAAMVTQERHDHEVRKEFAGKIMKHYYETGSMMVAIQQAFEEYKKC